VDIKIPSTQQFRSDHNTRLLPDFSENRLSLNKLEGIKSPSILFYYNNILVLFGDNRYKYEFNLLLNIIALHYLQVNACY